MTTPTTLERPVYGMSQAARLLGLRTDALRRWVDGYERAGTTYVPVIREEHTGSDTITWGEFVQLAPGMALAHPAHDLPAAQLVDGGAD